jgi:hypothetical protein
MPAGSMNDAEAFYIFLGEQLHLGNPSQTPEELLESWRRQRDYQETVTAVREGVRDMEAGRMRPLRELLNEATATPEAGS